MTVAKKVGPRPLPERAATKIGQLNRIEPIPFCKLPYSLLSRSDVSATAKIVFAYLLDRQGRKGVSWPSLNTIAFNCGTTKPAVVRNIAELDRAGLVTVRRPLPSERGRSNRYEIPIGVNPKQGMNHNSERSRIVTVAGNETSPEPESENQRRKPDPRYRT